MINSAVGKKAVCPIAGCSATLTINDIKFDPQMAKRLKRYEAAEEERKAERAATQSGRQVVVDSDAEGGGEDADSEGEKPTQGKMEQD